jgi:DNA-binding transcriptional MerR regulator
MIYSIKAAAMATGVTESRLRTWERRYGIPVPARGGSGRRQYAEGDLNVVRRIAALIDAGMPAGEAAAAVRSEPDATAPILENSRTHPLVGLFVQKARGFDAGWILRIVRDSVYSSGWDVTMERIAFPALRRLSRDWSEGRATMAHVRFAHELVRGEVLAELSRLGALQEAAPTVLLGCAEDDSYDIAALSLALGLRQNDVRVVYIGCSVPTADLIEAAQQLEPDVLCLVGTRRASPGALARCARTLVSGKLPSQLFVGGSVLTRRDAPEIPGIHLPQTLSGAVERLVTSVRRG